MTDTAVSPVPSPPAANEAAKRVILLTVFLDLLGFGIIIPQLGVYAAQFGAAPNVIGVLASSYSAMGFLFTPFWGRLSDRIGRRPVMLASIFGTAVGYVIFGFAHSIAWLFAARIIDGITGGNIATAQAYLTDVTPARDRSKTFGTFGAILGIGFATGPLIGALITQLPGIWGTNFGIGIFTAALASINWLLALWRLPETLSPEVRRINAVRHVEDGGKWQLINVRGFRRAWSLPGLNYLIAIAFIATTAFATLQGTYTLFLIRRYLRPQVQSLIASQPARAIEEARRDSAITQTTAPPGMESGAAADVAAVRSAADVPPYSRALGGDFNSPHAPPPGQSWRAIEKMLVRPRAASLAAWVFGVIGIVSLVVQGGLIGPLKKRFGEINLVMAGTLIMALGLALIPFPGQPVWQFPVLALMALGNGMATPVLAALVSELSPEHERGEIIGVYQSAGSLGRIVGPNLGGQLFNLVSPGAPYWAGGVIMLVAFSTAVRLARRQLKATSRSSF